MEPEFILEEEPPEGSSIGFMFVGLLCAVPTAFLSVWADIGCGWGLAAVLLALCFGYAILPLCCWPRQVRNPKYKTPES